MVARSYRGQAGLNTRLYEDTDRRV